MNPKLFDELVESLEQMGEIRRGERQPSRAYELETPSADGPKRPAED